MEKLWFKRKWYGWGWTPSSWEGWAVTGFFLAVVILIALTFTSETSVLEAIGSLAVPVLLLIATCYMTGESPRWQWGRPHDENETE